MRVYEALSYHLNCIRASNIGGWKDITKKVHANEIFIKICSHSVTKTFRRRIKGFRIIKLLLAVTPWLNENCIIVTHYDER